MWIRLMIYFNLFAILTNQLRAHIPEDVTTPKDRIDLHCVLAETCVHDTISICGRMGEVKKTFMDICDMLEYACDTGNVYKHTNDEDDCPPKRTTTKPFIPDLKLISF